MRWLVFILLLSFCSCTEQYCYENDIKFEEGWSFDHSFVSEIGQEDFRCPHVSGHLIISHTDDYPFENIYLRLSVTQKENITKEQVVSFPLQDDLGRWLGNQKNDSYQAQLSLPFEMPSVIGSDSYILKIEQYTREDLLKGVKGLKLVLN